MNGQKPLFPDAFDGWADATIASFEIHGREWEVELEAIAAKIDVTPDMVLAGRLALVALLREPVSPTNDIVAGIYRAMQAAREKAESRSVTDGLL